MAGGLQGIGSAATLASLLRPQQAQIPSYGPAQPIDAFANLA
jgi:hypothetical protein